MEPARIDSPLRIGVDDGDIGGGSFFEPAGVDAHNGGRAGRQFRYNFLERHSAGPHQVRQQDGNRGFESDYAERRVVERSFLFVIP